MTVIDVTLADDAVNAVVEDVTVDVAVEQVTLDVTIPPAVVVDVAVEDGPTFEFTTADPLVVDVVGLGAPGPQGPQGDVGPQGLSGGSYTHQQLAPSATWTISHELGFYPNVTVLDSAGTFVLGEVSYPDANTVVLSFSSSFGGVAYLS